MNLKKMFLLLCMLVLSQALVAVRVEIVNKSRANWLHVTVHDVDGYVAKEGFRKGSRVLLNNNFKRIEAIEVEYGHDGPIWEVDLYSPVKTSSFVTIYVFDRGEFVIENNDGTGEIRIQDRKEEGAL